MHLSVPRISNHHRQENIITWHYDLLYPSQQHLRIVQFSNPNLNPSHPSHPIKIPAFILHSPQPPPKPIHPQVHINILEKKKCCPMGCRTVRPRSPSGFFLKRRSKSLPGIFCVPRRAIASRHSDWILQEESCLEMFTI